MTARSADARALKPFGVDADVLNTVLDERFRIDSYIGASNGAEVYGAFDLAMNKQVVIKVLRPRFLVGEDFGARLRQEYELLRAFDHPNIIKVQGHNQTSDGAVYFVREHVPGATLAEIVKRQGPIDVARLSVILDQIASALDAVHDAQIIHRDICPEHLLVAKDDKGNDLVKLTNFGLAKALGELHESATDALVSGAAVVTGSPNTISPEVAAGDKYGHLADVYSLGVVLYYALVGKMPFESKSPNQLVVAHLTQPPPRFAERESTVWVPENVESVVMASLAKKPHNRPQSAGELAEMFREAVGQFRSGDAPVDTSPSKVMKKRPSVNKMKPGHSSKANGEPEAAHAPSPSYTPNRALPTPYITPLTLVMTMLVMVVVALVWTLRI
jgi:eukaryotic-like serine/threonine-protein kinase